MRPSCVAPGQAWEYVFSDGDAICVLTLGPRRSRRRKDRRTWHVVVLDGIAIDCAAGTLDAFDLTSWPTRWRRIA